MSSAKNGFYPTFISFILQEIQPSFSAHLPWHPDSFPALGDSAPVQEGVLHTESTVELGRQQSRSGGLGSTGSTQCPQLISTLSPQGIQWGIQLEHLAAPGKMEDPGRSP